MFLELLSLSVQALNVSLGLGSGLCDFDQPLPRGYLLLDCFETIFLHLFKLQQLGTEVRLGSESQFGDLPNVLLGLSDFSKSVLWLVRLVIVDVLSLVCALPLVVLASPSSLAELFKGAALPLDVLWPVVPLGFVSPLQDQPHDCPQLWQ